LPTLLRFGPFQIDVASGELRKEGHPVRLQPQPLKVLVLLAGHAGELVSREQLRAQVWSGDTFVDFEQGLNYCIKEIRAALEDAAKSPRYIETLQRRGYRFIAPVERVSAKPAGSRILLAVLPFENLSGDPAQEYLSDGLTDEMIAQLGRINPSRLGVIARTSAMKYKATDKGIAVIGHELGVSYILEGTVRRGTGRIRVTAQLIQVADQTHLWAESFDRDLGDMLALQSDVARAIADEIRVQLTPREEGRLAGARTPRPDAYDAFLKGRYLWNRRTRDALDESVRSFERAIAIDATYAPAYAGLADAYLTQLDYNHRRPADAVALANRAALQAVEMDEGLAEPHTSLGHLRLHQFDWIGAEHHFKRAIDLNPGYGVSHYYYANLLAALGRFDSAVVEAQGALDLDPMSPNARQNLTFILYLARRYDQALAYARKTLESDPAFGGVYYDLGLIYQRLGKYDEALAAFGQVGATAKRGNTVLAAVGATHALAGRQTEGRAALAHLEGVSATEYVSTYDLALLNVALGDGDGALTLLHRACDEHSAFMPFLNVDARLDTLRADPRFTTLVRRLGLS
jgi:TolB-like protein/Flp pilus assembly protein TadD